MAGERNLGRGRTVRSKLNPQSVRVSAKEPTFGKVLQRKGVARITTGGKSSRVSIGKVKLSRARSTSANLGRSANFTAPRGSRGGAKWHGK